MNKVTVTLNLENATTGELTPLGSVSLPALVCPNCGHEAHTPTPTPTPTPPTLTRTHANQHPVVVVGITDRYQRYISTGGGRPLQVGDTFISTTEASEAIGAGYNVVSMALTSRVQKGGPARARGVLFQYAADKV
jgi:hypothetical protein